MSLYDDWKTKTSYKFTTIGSGLLPLTYTDIELIAISTFDAAKRMGGNNLAVQWRQLYPHLPQGTPDSPSDTEWLVFESKQGEIIILAVDWIVGSSVEVVDFTQAVVTITQTNYADMMILRDFMIKRGMKFDITFK